MTGDTAEIQFEKIYLVHLVVTLDGLLLDIL